MKKHLKAYALPAVLVMSAVVLLMIFFAYDSLALKYRRYALYREAHQERGNLTSALNLYLYDSLLCAAGDSADIFLFDGEDSVHVSVFDWGLYERVRLSNSSPDALTVLVGRRTECPAEAAFWICDRNRALSLAADARIEGLAYIPMNGLNYTEIACRFPSLTLGSPVRTCLRSTLRLSERHRNCACSGVRKIRICLCRAVFSEKESFFREACNCRRMCLYPPEA